MGGLRARNARLVCSSTHSLLKLLNPDGSISSFGRFAGLPFRDGGLRNPHFFRDSCLGHAYLTQALNGEGGLAHGAANPITKVIETQLHRELFGAA
jgi:hypothetical protein